MFFVEAFFECVIHGIDSGFAFFIAIHSIDIGFLNEKENEEKGDKNSNDNNF